MSPELERLLEALYERDHCEPDQRGRYERNVRRLISDALQRLPNVSHDQFLEALKDRYQQFKKARRKFTSIPPRS
jgi:predicted YcjX-like family ATPase